MRRTPTPTVAFFAALVALGGCGGAAGAPPRTPPRGEYRVTADDTLEIVVWKEPGLSASAPVRPDGRITVPGVGSVMAAGRTPRELEEEIRAALSRTISSPIVSVVVKETGARVFVIGEVTRPGAYPLRGELTVLQALALAGGLTEFADRGGIVVLRSEEGKQRTYRFSYGDAIGGGAPFALVPGDTIVVP